VGSIDSALPTPELAAAWRLHHLLRFLLACAALDAERVGIGLLARVVGAEQLAFHGTLVQMVAMLESGAHDDAVGLGYDVHEGWGS
jgi:hypothetical protein